MLDYPSAEDYLNPLYASSSADGHGSNDGDYKSAEFDKLLNAALAQTDVKKRTEDFTKAQEVLANDLPVIPLWNDNVAAVSATNNEWGCESLMDSNPHSAFCSRFVYLLTASNLWRQLCT